MLSYTNRKHFTVSDLMAFPIVKMGNKNPKLIRHTIVVFVVCVCVDRHQTSSSLNVGSQLLSESQSVSAATQHRDFSDKDVDAAVKDIEAGLSS